VAARPRITVVGSINLDLVARVERLPRPGETLTDAELARVPGGKGANQAVAAARLGAEVRFVGSVGDDEIAAEARRGLEDAGVDLTGLRIAAGEPTGLAMIVVSERGDNQIVVAPGANRALGADAFDLADADGVLCQLEVPIEAVAAAAEQTRGMFCLNAAPARIVPEEVLARADLIVANSFELETLGSTPLDGLFALTLGAEGALLLEDGNEIARAVPPGVHAVDGTAAGDAFCACLAVSLLEGRSREEALWRACAAGAIAASRPGAQSSLPTAAEVDAILSG
jgi:ribokinase